MEAARTSETLVQLYQTTRCYNPEDSHLHTHRRENLKYYSVIMCYPTSCDLTVNIYNKPLRFAVTTCFKSLVPMEKKYKVLDKHHHPEK
jgi:hypothetical protein